MPSAPSTSRTSSIISEDDGVGGPPAAVADDHPGRDPLVAQAALGRAVEDELDGRSAAGIDAAQPADQRGGRRAPADVFDSAWSRFVPSTSRRRVAASGFAIGLRHRANRTRREAPGYDRAMGLLLLVDLDGVVYRGADPVPGVAAVLADRAARGDDVVYVTNNSMHYRADYQTRLAAMGCAGHARHRRVVGARDGALPARARSGDPARAGPRRGRARARAARRRATTS